MTMLDQTYSSSSGIAKSRVKYATMESNNVENNNALASAAKPGVPCVSLRSRFASEFKSPRSPLGEIKLNDQERTPSRTATPRKGRAGVVSVQGTPSKAKEGCDTLARAGAFARDCAVWSHPARSCLVFSSGFLGLLTWHYAETGIIDFRPSVSLAYCGLGMLAVNFFGSIFFENYVPKPVVTRGLVERAARTAEGVALSLVPGLNRAFSGASGTATLQVAFALWTLITASKFMSLSLIALVAHCAAFTLPLLYKRFERDLKRNAVIAKKLALSAWNGVNLDRKYKLSAVGLGLGFLWVLCDAHTKIVSLFIAVIAFKCFLLPNEVETITSVAAPMTTRVSRKARRISMGAGEMLRDGLGLKQLVSPAKPPMTG